MSMDRTRQLPVISEEGHRRLAGARAAVVGCGALGSYIAVIAYRLGIENLVLIDRDVVQATDLHRSVYTHEDIGVPKAEALSMRFSGGAEHHVVDLCAGNIQSLLKGCDIVLDGTDNLLTRFVVNDHCVKVGIPWVYSALLSTYGQVMPVIPGRTACLRCYMREAPAARLPTCATAGVLAATPPVIAGFAVSAAADVLLNRGVSSGIYMVETRPPKVYHVKLDRDPECPSCVRGRYRYLEQDFQVVPSCGNGYHVRPPVRMNVDLKTLAQAVGTADAATGEYISFRDGDVRITVFRDGRMLVEGKGLDEKTAKSLYARYMG